MDIDDLKNRELALAGELEQLRHELRRVTDRLERAGGADRGLELKVRQLRENIKICETDLQTVTSSIYITSR